MTDHPSLTSLGWSEFFQSQLDEGEQSLTPTRICGLHRARIDGLTSDGPVALPLTGTQTAGELAIGDWLLSDGARIIRRLTRQTELGRRAAGTGNELQLIAANVDTLFIVTSCNADFNPARIERYLALAAEADIEAVILLTKSDTTADAESYRQRAEALSRRLTAVALDARDPDIARTLGQWCRTGRTVALLGASGVGKTTLTNTLTGLSAPTGEIREDDARGRHTTTNRALYPITGGGWLIDTPGMRALALIDAGAGIDAVFEDVTEHLGNCRFRDCTHQSEPGCAVRQAINEGRLDEERLLRWQKLKLEDRYSTETVAEARERARRFGKKVRTALSARPRF